MTTVRMRTRERETLDLKMDRVVVNQGSHAGETVNDKEFLSRILMTTTRTGQLKDGLSLEGVHRMTDRVKSARESLALKLRWLTMGLLSVAGWENL